MPNPGAGLVHSQLGRSLASVGFYKQRVSIQEATGTTDLAGRTTNTWSTTPGLANRPCRITAGPAGSRATGRAGGHEIRRPDETLVLEPWAIAFPRDYPAITTKHRAIAGGKTFAILAVDTDAETGFTWLTCEVVE